MGSRTRNSIRAEPPRGGNTDLGDAVATASPAQAARVAQIAATLAELWPDAVVELDHRNAYQLLVATILAAQSTDKLINTVTPALFAKYPDPTALARADQGELEKMIFSTGFYRNKAKHVIGMARRIVEAHGGEVPDTMAGLVDLPGVARKTANVVLGSALGKNEGVVVDTHVSRLAPRLGLTTHTDPVKIEQDLMQLVPRDQWSIFAHRLIWHGRRVCHAKKPDCDHCTLAPTCPSYGIAGTDAEVRKPTGRQPLTRAQSAEKARARAASDAMTSAGAARSAAAAAKSAAARPGSATAKSAAAAAAAKSAAAAAKSAAASAKSAAVKSAAAAARPTAASAKSAAAQPTTAAARPTAASAKSASAAASAAAQRTTAAARPAAASARPTAASAAAPPTAASARPTAASARPTAASARSTAASARPAAASAKPPRGSREQRS